MTDHEITYTRDADHKHVAVCSCARWRSKGYKIRTDAQDAGDAHVVRGDEHNRAIAQFNRGQAQLRTELKWYEEQSENMLNSEKDREMWTLLADELRKRLGDAPDEGQLGLF